MFVSFCTYYIWQLLINILNIQFNRMCTTISIPFSYVSVSIRVLVPLVVQELSSHPFLVGFALIDLQLYVYVLQIVVCPFVLFVLSGLLRFTNSDCPFGIFKLCLSSAVLFSFKEGLTCLIDFEIGLSTIDVFLIKLFFWFNLT